MDIKYQTFDRSISLDKQRKLFVECFPENIGTQVETVDHYNWKFNSLPGQVKSYEFTANYNENLIGYYAAIPYKYSINGKLFTVGMVCDVMTGIAARGKGVFTKLGRYSINKLKRDGVDFTSGYPIRPEVIPGHIKVGWELPFELPIFGKFISLKTFLLNRNLSILTVFANLVLKSWNELLSISNPSFSDIKVELYNQKELISIIGLQDFLDKLIEEIPNYLCKDIPFLNWRLGAPEKEYSIFIIRKESTIIGYSVSRYLIMEKIPCHGILDMAFLSGFEKYSTLLLRENENLAKTSNAELIATMIGNKWAKKFYFFRNGYLKTPHKFSFIFNKLNESLSTNQLSREENWHLMWIDSDDL